MSIFWSTANNGGQLIDFDTTSIVSGAATTTVIASSNPGSWGGLAFGPDGTAYTLMGSNQTLASVNLSTGALTKIGTGSSTNFGSALDFNPVDGKLYAINSTGNTSFVYTVNTTTGVFTQVGTVTGESGILDITFDAAGHLYAVGASTSQNSNVVYSINTTTWAATAAFTTALSNLSGIAADAQGNLVATSTLNPSKFETINVTTGVSAIVATVGSTQFDRGGDIFLIGAPTGLQLDAATDSGTTGDNITSSTAPVIDGLALAGSTVRLLDGANVVGQGVADSTGHFKITSSTLAEGTHQLTATATLDGSTSAASAQLSITVDTTAPAAPSGLADSAIAGGYVNAARDTASQTVSGTAEAGATITVSDGTTALGTTTADSKGNWSYTLGALADGSHSLTATATDAAGNVSTASTALAFTVDTLAPAAPGALADSAIVGGYVNAARDTASQTVSGTAEAGATITVSDGTTALGTTTADSKGNWSYTLGALADGSHSITATATDAAGNVSVASAALAFTVDTQAPGVPGGLGDTAIVSGYVNAAHDTASQAVSGTAEAGSTVSISDGTTALGTTTADSTGNWSYTLGVLADGSHSLTATATDAAGNVSTASTALAFTVDTLAPAAPGGLADAAIVGGYVNAAHETASQSVSGTAESGATVTISDGTTALGTTTADSNGNWSYTLGVLADGSHSLTATATDAAGNVSTASTALAFTVDTQAPDAPSGLADEAIVGGYVNAANDTAAQTLSGTAEAGATITVSDGATALGTATADSTGNWSYTLGVLADGSHGLTATAKDAAGNVSPASTALAFTVDTLAPAAPGALADAAIVSGYVNAVHDTASQGVSGTAEAGATITVSDGTTALGTTTADSNGNWSYTLGVLSDGSHSLTATATDAAGNVSAASTALAFTVDTVAPGAPSGLADAAIVSGYVNAAHDTASQSVSGTAEAGAAITVSDGTTALGTTTADSKGNWSYTLGVLTDGSHSVTATATDAAGNVSAGSTALSFTVDTVAPGAPGALADAAIVSGYVNAVHDTASQAVSGTAEAGATITVSDGTTALGTATADSNGNWSYTLGALADGSHSITATATDPAGNVSTASTALAFTVDTLAPAAPGALADAAIGGGYVNAARDTASQTVSGTAEAGATITVSDGSSALGTTTADSNGNWTYTVGVLADGSYSITATATDAAGNVSTVSTALAFTVDTQAPAAPSGLSDTAVVSGYVNAAHDAASQAVSGNAEAGATITVFDGTTALGTTTADSTGNWSYTLGVLADGSHSLTATATDAAGNVSTASTALAFTVDTLAPVTPSGLADAAIVSGYVNAANDTASQALSGTAEAGATITVSDGTTALGTTTADSTGNWSYTLGVLADGSHSLTAIATDAAGNSSSASTALAFTVDTLAPAAPSVALKNDTGASGTDGITKDATLAISGTELNATIQYSTDAQTWTSTFSAAEGSNTVYVRETDLAGNASVASQALTFTLDTTAPLAPTGLADASIVNGFVNAANNTASQTLTGLAEAGSTVVISDGTQQLNAANPVTVDSTGHWSVTLGSLAQGLHSLTAVATDGAGNVGPASGTLAFTVDTVLPLTAISDVVQTATRTSSTTLIKGTTEANSTVTVFDTNGSALGTSKADASGNWTLSLANLSSVVHVLTASAVDAAGNSGPASNKAFFGTTGNDALMGVGNGDVLLGNGGNNAMLAAAGADTFVFHANFGKNAIGSFSPTQDVLAFDHALVPTVATDAALFSWMIARTSDVAGSAVIALDAQDTIALTGVSKAMLTAANFHLV